jgi:hypothetical protein
LLSANHIKPARTSILTSVAKWPIVRSHKSKGAE